MPLGLLLQVVLQQCDRETTQRDDRDEVDGGHDTHEQVGQAPDQVDRPERPADHGEEHESAEDVDRTRALAEEVDVGLAVVRVPQDRGEGQEEDDDGQERHAPLADLRGERVLCEGDALPVAAELRVRQQDDERGGRTDDQGVEVDTQGLDQALFDRV